MDFSKPQLLFAGIWTVAFFLASTVETTMSVPFGWQMYLLVFGGMASFFLIGWVTRLFMPIAKGTPRFPAPPASDLALLSDFILRVFVVWLFGFMAVIAYSGGIPIYWLLTGSGRNYIDFGIPSVSGLLNMMRAFMTASVVLIYLEGRLKRRDLVIAGVLVASALGEVSRGVVSALLLHVVAVYILLRPIRGAQIAAGIPVLILSFVLFDYVGNIRTLDSEMNLGEVLGGSFQDQSILSNFVWSFTYITTPLNNLAYAISYNPEPLMVPYFTLQPLVPTVIRSMIWDVGNYPIELVNEAFNATTFYSPLVTDFGVFGALIGFVIIQIIVMFGYNSAKRGNIYGILVYPPIFVSVTLSFFYSFFFALPIVSYPILASVFMGFRRRRIQSARRLEQQLAEAEARQARRNAVTT